MEWGRFYGFPEAFAIVAKTVDPRDEEGKFKTPAMKREEALAAIEDFEPRHGGVFRMLAEVYEEGNQRLRLLDPAETDDSANVVGVAEVVEGAAAAWDKFNEFHGEVRGHWKERRKLEKDDTGDVNAIQEEARLALKETELELRDDEAEYGTSSPEYAAARDDYMQAAGRFEEKQAWAGEEFARIRVQIDKINEQNGRYLMSMVTAGEGLQPPQRKLMRLDEIVHAYPANRLTFGEKVGVYMSRWWEYLSDEPREANSEGGVFPAIFGTVIMTLMMALAVVPFGVLAALYLREYAKAGPVVSAVRIAVNNLAGVPSIVFGVFGLGFFCYGVGSFIDGGPSWVMPRGSWFILLSVAAIVAAAAFFTFLRSVNRPGTPVTRAKRMLRYGSIALWIAATVTVMVLVATTPFFDGFYRSRLPNPTFGKGALIWASFTLALMTLPVVIVATEEALAAVPNSMREGSYACGASKWQTIRRIVLPRALPGIMTGMILAMARGAGEVAPLMLVGAVKLAPELPFDWAPPFGLNRSFMHLGFHIYDVGFQSQNSEAAKPMVYTTTLLLILIIAVLNISAIWLRSRLRRRFVSDQF
jgi:ABC-type phosphate transport system permease subunit